MKRLIFIISILLFIVIICITYTYKKSVFSDMNSIYAQRIEINYNESDICMLGYVVIGKDEIMMGIPERKKTVKISMFESYLLHDYAVHILNLYNSHEKNKSSSGVRGFMIYTGDTLNYEYPNYRICREIKGDFKTNLFALMALTIYYFKFLLPVIATIYLIFIAVGLILRSKGNTLNSKTFNSQVVFLILSIITTVLLDSVFSKESIYGHLTHQQIFFPLILDKTNFVIGIVMLISELIILFIIYKDFAICRLYAISYMIQIMLHKVFFKGESMRDGIAGALRQIIGFSEVFPVYPKLIWFTLFFTIGFAVNFIFGAFTNKNTYQNYCMSIVFSISSALLMCMTSYVSIYTIRLL